MAFSIFSSECRAAVYAVDFYISTPDSYLSTAFFYIFPYIFLIHFSAFFRSFSYFNTDEEIDAAVAAVREMAET